MGDGELFLVQVWAQPRFRVSVRAVGDEHALLFDEPGQLSDFFRSRLDPPIAAVSSRQALVTEEKP
jgi:hypothetical protein